MKCFIITGTSRGLGEAMAARLIGQDNLLFCISRHMNRNLGAMAARANAHLESFAFDLADSAGIEPLLEKIVQAASRYEIKGYYLINNAGVLQPVGPADQCSVRDIAYNHQVNAIAPAILTSGFIRLTNAFDGDKRILNISSGAGRKPYYGWSSYCSAKAALDMFTRCVATEQEYRPHPVKIVSFVPGIIDTEMQQIIRNSTKEEFIQLDRFIEFKTSGKLKPADFVAERAIELLFDDNIPSGSLIDIGSYPPRS